MQTKKYLVTNNSEGSICITGRQRIDIPGLCKDLPLVLPENTARQTISRLKQRYPLLKIREANEDKGLATSPPSDPEKSDAFTGTSNNLPATASSEPGNDKNNADSDKKSNDAGGTESSTEKNTPQSDAAQTPAATQKVDNKKGK